MRVPKIRNIETALQIYYSNIELDNHTIQELFLPVKGATLSTASLVGLKDMAREKMRQGDIPIYNGVRVNTKAAYEAWGIDIGDLETRWRKLKKLEIGGGE